MNELADDDESVQHVCRVCRRLLRLCICVSHSPVRAVHYDVKAGVRTTRPFDSEYLEMLLNEAMVHYYNRDADGLQRWLRRVLP